MRHQGAVCNEFVMPQIGMRNVWLFTDAVLLFVKGYDITFLKLFSALCFSNPVHEYLTILNTYFGLETILNQISEFEKLTEANRQLGYNNVLLRRHENYSSCLRCVSCESD